LIPQIGSIFAEDEPYWCAFALYLPELRFTLARSPLAAFSKLARHYSGHCRRAFYRRGRVSIETSFFCFAQNGIGANTTNGDRYFKRHPKLGQII
jgi:hypothetical protein